MNVESFVDEDKNNNKETFSGTLCQKQTFIGLRSSRCRFV
jgi:hypothetical protein